nr:EOG090X0IV9 [Triops cancriformis]
MSDKLGLGLGSEVRPLRLGSSFTSKNNPFHTIRYDFKPASVDTSKMACVEVANNNQVTVTVPHCDGAGTASTVFRGPQKPYNRECVLIIDNETGQITLEKLSQNLMLKKTRAEGSSRMSALVPEDPPPPPSSSSSSLSRPSISSSSSSFHPPSSSSSHSYSQPHSKKPSPGRKSAHMKRSVSPLTKSPPAPPQVSKPAPAHAPPSTYAPPQALPLAPKLPGSMPFLGLDMEDDSDGDQSNSPFHMPSAFSATAASVPTASSVTSAASTTAIRDVPEIGVLSDSSSDSGSDSSSSSDSDSDSDIDKRSVPRHNGPDGGSNRAEMERAAPPPAATPTLSMPSHLLSEDLQLSDSGSDSD